MTTKPESGAPALPSHLIYYDGARGFKGRQFTDVFVAVPVAKIKDFKRGDKVWIEFQDPISDEVRGYNAVVITRVIDHGSRVVVSFFGPCATGSVTIRTDERVQGRIFQVADEELLVAAIDSIPMEQRVGWMY